MPYASYSESLDDAAVKRIGVRTVVRKPVDTDALHALFGTLLSKTA